MDLLIAFTRGRLPSVGRVLALLLILAAVISVAAAAFVLTASSVAIRHSVSRPRPAAVQLTSTRRPPRHPRR